MPMLVWVLVTIVVIGSVAGEVIAENTATVVMVISMTLWLLFVASSPLLDD